MKKVLLLFSIAALLGVVYYFLSLENKEKTSVTIEDREFVVDNEDDIQIITIKSKAYPLMHLERKDKDWILNRKYKANPIVIGNMLGALTKMRIKYIPPRSQNKMIAESVERVGIEIKTYDSDGRILSDFIMAGNTNDEAGTYCLKRGASQSYVMSMPILEGGLRNYFDLTQIKLRDKTIFAFDPTEIKSVRLDYLKDRPSSFLLEKEDNSYYISATGKTGTPKQKANRNIAYAYFNDFDKVMSEVINDENPELKRLEGLLPFAELTITTHDNNQLQVDLYPDLDIFDKTINTRSLDDLGQVERYFVKTSEGGDFIVQHRLISKCLKTLKYFTTS